MNVVVLHSARCSRFDSGCFDESRQRSSNPQSSSRQVFLCEKDTMNEASHVVLEDPPREPLSVDRSFLQPTKLSFQLFDELPIFALDKVGTVESMRLQHRVGQERLLAHHSNVADPFESLNRRVLSGVPAGRFEPVGHALSALDEKLWSVLG